ncbi:MAG: polyphosphate kinase 1 [candidate division FCPU426 bacterium]
MAGSGRFFNRDESLLQFNRRVLEQALDVQAPVLERVRFMAIFSSNTDEFFMKRSVRLHDTPELAKHCRRTVMEMAALKDKTWAEELLPALREAGIRLASWQELDPAERKKAGDYFKNEVFPILTPLAVGPSHPFPFLSNLSHSLGVKLSHPDGGKPHFARIKVPDSLPHWVTLSEKPLLLLRMTDLISAHLQDFFPGMTVDNVMAFRVTRNARVDLHSDDVEDLLDMVAEELRQRRVAGIVRVQLASDTDPWTLDFLKGELGLPEEDFYPSPGELEDSALFELAALDRPDLKYPAWTPKTPPALKSKSSDLFKVLRGRDLLVHFPFESFDASVLRFISDAAKDKQVLALKVALYRLGDNSPIVPLLIKAAEAGKQVVCLVELKARFDEARNILVSETLEKAGVHVVYGVVGLKTHSKICLVVRREKQGLRYYGHVGTGNYNPATAHSYTDFGLFTSDRAICEDLIEIFNYLTGLSLLREYKKFLIAPVNMRKRFLELIHDEAANAAKGLPSGIVAKMNSLEDTEICDALYAASAAGVRVDLIVRGLCCLKPGVKGLSENIRVVSIVGRFLEHSRCYHFRAGAETGAKGLFFIGSSDWMARNLNERVESVAPVEDPSLRERIWETLQLYITDRVQAWELREDGNYERPQKNPGELGVQDLLMGKSR